MNEGQRLREHLRRVGEVKSSTRAEDDAIHAALAPSERLRRVVELSDALRALFHLCSKVGRRSGRCRRLAESVPASSIAVLMDDAVARLLRAVASIEPRFGLRVCVIGGIARGIWALPRATADVDVIVDTPDPSEVTALASQLGLVCVDSEVKALAAAAMTRLRLPEELTGATRIDVIARSHEYYGRVLDRSVVLRALGLEVRVASAEDVIVLKALADRPQDRLDVAAIIAAQGERLDRELIRQECAALDIELPGSLPA